MLHPASLLIPSTASSPSGSCACRSPHSGGGGGGGSCEMGQRTCRRPRPAEPPPFGPYASDKEKAANYYLLRRNRSPRRPRPLVGRPPSPSPVENTSSCTSTVVAPIARPLAPPTPVDSTSPCTSIVVAASSAKTFVLSDVDFTTSEALDGDQEWRAPPEGISQSGLGCSRGKDGGEDGRRSMRVEVEVAGDFPPSRVNVLSVEKDPLVHSGRWVPAEYGQCKEMPWTGYWTCCGHKSSFTMHCPDFGARMHQREADHQRNLAAHVTRARHAVAEKTRARWENRREQQANNPSYAHDIMHSDGCTAKTAAVGDHPNRREGDEARPFLRRKWLARLDVPNGGGLPSDTTALDPNTCSSSGGGGGGLGVTQRNQPVVQRDHVRSVVQLALSESRVNAFVAISSLKGLLAVATEGLGGGLNGGGRRDGEGGGAGGGGSGFGDERNIGIVGDEGLPGLPSLLDRSRRGPRKKGHAEARAFTRNTKICDEKRSCENSRAERYKGRLPQHNRVENRSSELKGGAITPSKRPAGGRIAGSAEEEEACSGGAALCVKLGALPAVLGCLDEHPGHKDVEPLCIRLLHVFATDKATRGAIEGNTAVATACAARTFPKSGSEDSAGSTLASSTGATTCSTGTNASSAGANASSTEIFSSVGKSRKERLATVSEIPDGEVSSVVIDPDRQIPILDGSAAEAAAAECRKLTEAPVFLSSSSSLSAPVVSATSSGERLAAAAATGHEPDAGSPSSVMTTTRPNAETRAAATVPGGEFTGVDGQETKKALRLPPADLWLPPTDLKLPLTNLKLPLTDLKLPPTDLLFVLSVAIQGSRDCQNLVLRERGMEAMLGALKWTTDTTINVGDGGARRTETCLRVLENLGEGEQGRRRLIRGGTVESAVSAIESFRSHHGVLAAAMALLLALSGAPLGRSRILKVGGVRVILSAMQRLLGNAEVQWKGADLIRTLINEQPQARRELDSIRGGWQWLCQGTSGGDALVRYAPGEKHIPGWTISEEERLTTEEALAKAELIASEWTPYNLAAFMGTTRSHHKLQVGNLANHHFFRVVSEAGLLPRSHEDAHQWNSRLRRYEDERDIRVSHIVRRRLARDSSGAHATSLVSSSVSSF